LRNGYFGSLKNIFKNAKNLCNPLNLDDPEEKEKMCSMKCIDSNYTERIGLFYPKVSDFNMKNCPRFWQDQKIDIRLLNLTEAKFMDAIPRQTPYIVIAASLSIGVLSFVYVWHSSNLQNFYKKKLITKLNIITHFALPSIDTVFDAVYFQKIQSKLQLLHRKPAAFGFMASFLVAAVIKDLLMCFLHKWRYGKKRNDRTINNLEQTPGTNSRRIFTVKNPVLLVVWSKLGEEIVSYIFEDFVEVGIQFFYFEKFEFQPINFFVVINLVFMALKEMFVIYTIIKYMREKWRLKRQRLNAGLFIFAIICLISYPFARSIGAIYQASRGNAIVKGSCLRYDADKQILKAEPFIGGLECWNLADWIVMIAPICFIPILILLICSFCSRTERDEQEELQETRRTARDEQEEQEDETFIDQ